MAPRGAVPAPTDALMRRYTGACLPKSSVHRLTRGRRAARPVVVATQQMLCRFVQDQVDQSVAVAQHQQRSTVTAADVARAARVGMGGGGACDGCGRRPRRCAIAGASAAAVAVATERAPKRRRLVRGDVHRSPVADGGDEPPGDFDDAATAPADRPPALDPEPEAVTDEGGSSEREAPPPARKRGTSSSGPRGRGRAADAGLRAALRGLEAKHLAALDDAAAAVPFAVVDAYAECIRLWSSGAVRIQPIAWGRRLAAWTPETGGDDAALRGYILPAGGGPPVFLPLLDRERCALYVTVPSADPPRMYVATLRGRAPAPGTDGIRRCFEHLVRRTAAAADGTGRGRVMPLRCPVTTDASLSGVLLLTAMEAAALRVSPDEWEGRARAPDLLARIATDTVGRDVLVGRRGGLRRFLERLLGETDPVAAVRRNDLGPLMTSDPELGQPPESESEDEGDGPAGEGSSIVVVDEDDEDPPSDVGGDDAAATEAWGALLQPTRPVPEAVVDAYVRFLQGAKPVRTRRTYVASTSTARRIVDGTPVDDPSGDSAGGAETLLIPEITPRGARLFAIVLFPPLVLAMGFGGEPAALPGGVLTYAARFTDVDDPTTALLPTTACSVANAGLYLLLMIEHFVCFAPGRPIVTEEDATLPDMFPRAQQTGIARRMRHWLHDRLRGTPGDGDAPRGCYLRAATAVGLEPDGRQQLCGWHAANAILDQAGIPRLTVDELDAYAVRLYKRDLKRGAGWSEPSAMPRSDRFYAWMAMELALRERRLIPDPVGPLDGMDADADDLVGYILADGGHYVAIVPNAGGRGGGGWDLVDDGVRRVEAAADPVALVEGFFGRDAATIERDRKDRHGGNLLTYRITSADPDYHRNRRAAGPGPRAAGKGKGPPAVPPQRRSSRRHGR